MHRNPRSSLHERNRKQAATTIADLRKQIATLDQKIDYQHKAIVDGINERNRLHVEIAQFHGCYNKQPNA